jgi:hypothetical protein
MGAMSKLESFSRTIFCFILISLGCATSPTFCFCNDPIWLVYHKKRLKLWKILWKDGVPHPLAHVYRWERGGLWAKHMGGKWGAIENTIGEHIGNLENMMRTWYKHVGNKGKMKKIKALWVHAEASHWLHEISISKTVSHHFWPAIIPPL